MARIISWIYIGIGAIHLVSLLYGNSTISQMTKPALMPILIYWLFLKAEGNVPLPRLLLALALIFSWGGDILLLNQSKTIYFLSGLGSFLVAQLLYAFVLYKSTYHPPKFQFKAISPLLVLGTGFMVFVVPEASELAIPVALYGLCILAMIAMATVRNGYTSEESFRWAFIGASLFLLSDGLIATNKFIIDIPYIHFFVMGTYIPAQYLIVKGVMEHAS